MSSERSNFDTSSHFCCIQIYAEMAEKMQVKHRVFVFIGAPVVYDSLFDIVSLNTNLF